MRRPSLESRRCVMMDQKPYPAGKAREGEIILNTPLRRPVFLAGLIGALALAIVMTMMR